LKLRAARSITTLFALVFLAVACGNAESLEAGASGADRPVVVATTNILGDVVENLAGAHFDVVTVMPVGADPHHFQPSAKDVAALENATAIIANGAAFEEGLLDAIEAAEANGTPVFEAISAIDVVKGGHEDEHAGDDDEDHGEEEDHDDHGEEDDHADHGDVDPHFFTDPARMAVAADGIVEFLIASADTVDAAALRANGDRYIATLESLDTEVEAMLAPIPESQRVLVTNHPVFAYFADRYGFEVVGTVVPRGNSANGVSGRRLVELTQLLKHKNVSVVFTDTSSSDELALTLSNEVGDIAVIKLFSESLGDSASDGATYVEMVRTNARQISEALSG